MGCILFQLITSTPLFPGETDGAMLLEHAQIKGMPSKNELKRMERLCEEPIISLFGGKIKQQRLDLKKLMGKLSKHFY
jgi:hypothetical protein